MKDKKVLGVFALAMVNVAAVLSLRNFPAMAEYGWSSIAWYLLGTLLFLLPVSLVGAELATGWPKGGGVYAWVREAFGERWGFLAVWCEWSENLVWFPTVLSFIGATIAFAIDPALASNRLFMFVTMMVVFWGLTILNFFGTRTSSVFGSIGVIAGTIIPAVLIIGLGAGYIFSGQSSQIAFSGAALVPSFDLGSLPFVATVVLLFAGMEMAGYHALEVRRPQHDFPLAMLVAGLIIFVLSVIGTLAVAVVVPHQQILLAAGLMQAFQAFLGIFGLGGWLPVIAILVAVGAFALLSTWLFGPAKGLGEAAARGDLPEYFGEVNGHGSPAIVLVIQAAIGTVLSLFFLFLPSVNAAYWILTAMTVEVLCITYLLVFAAAIRLRYSQPEVHRAYRVPGGLLGMWVVAGAGFLACAFTFLVGFFPPSNVAYGDAGTFVLAMVIGTLVLSAPPFVFAWSKGRWWGRQSTTEPEPAKAIPV